MYFRLLLLTPLTLLSLFIAAMELTYSDEFPWVFGTASLVGLYGIWYALWYEIRFKFIGGFLVIDSLLRPAERFDMEDLISWQDYGHNIRAQ